MPTDEVAFRGRRPHEGLGVVVVGSEEMSLDRGKSVRRLLCAWGDPDDDGPCSWLNMLKGRIS